jgi:hypothetical protein
MRLLPYPDLMAFLPEAADAPMAAGFAMMHR